MNGQILESSLLKYILYNDIKHNLPNIFLNDPLVSFVVYSLHENKRCPFCGIYIVDVATHFRENGNCMNKLRRFVSLSIDRYLLFTRNGRQLIRIYIKRHFLKKPYSSLGLEDDDEEADNGDGFLEYMYGRGWKEKNR